MSQSTGSITARVPVPAATAADPSFPAPILALSDEVIIHFLTYLNHQELATCGLVCWQWRELSLDDFLWKDLFKSRFPLRNPSEIPNFRKAYQDQFLLHHNFANGVYASHILAGHRATIKSLVPTADGKHLFSGSFDNTIKRWDLETRKCLNITTYGGPKKTLACTEKELFSAGTYDSPIAIWDLETREYITTLRGHEGAICSMTVADEHLFSAFSDNTIEVWNLKTRQCVHTFETGHTYSYHCIAVANGELFAAYDYDKTIKVWDLKTYECTHTFEEHTDPISSLVAYDRYLLSASSDKTIKLWDLQARKCIHTFEGHAVQVLSIAISDGKLFSGSADGTIKIWDLKTYECLHTLTGNPGAPLRIAATHGKLFATFDDLLTNNKTIRMWDFNASHRAIFEEIAGQFTIDAAEAMDRFSRMPQRERNEVYAALDEMLKDSFDADYPNRGEHAFHDQAGLSSTPEQKAQAIRKYLAG